MNTVSASSAGSSPAAARGVTRFTLVRILLATLAVCLPVALVLVLAHQIPDKAMRIVWPQLLAALLCVGGYAWYLRKIEGRALTELSGPGVGRELGLGVALGALMFLAIIGVLAACGSYRFTGAGSWTAMIKPFAEMVVVALVEEILFRGVLFRLTERALGTWIALAVSSVLFALAHLPNEGITALSVGITALAGAMFAAAYMATRRLWLAIGLHFAWNFMSDGVFSLPTSGNAAKGFLQGQLSGPEWLAGGAYGVEASSVTLVAVGLAAALLLRHAIRSGRAPLATDSKAGQ
jgi:membrane protease YdiL (CAAX protease family)